MDLEQFRIKANEEKAALVAFLNIPKSERPDDLAELVSAADAAVWRETDCLECANCCKTMTPAFTNQDIIRIATHLRMKSADFKARWLKKEPKSGHWVNVKGPCQFLLPDNKCSVYAVRPVDCAGFPHHDKQPFEEYVETYRKNIVHCPATYNFVNILSETMTKKATG